jgi:hypothetical protein
MIILLIMLFCYSNRGEAWWGAGHARACRAIFLSTCVSIILAGFPQAGRAADLPVKAEPVAPPPAVSWTGFYLGGEIGTDFSSARFFRPQSTLDQVTFQSTQAGMPFTLRPSQLSAQLGAAVHF